MKSLCSVKFRGVLRHIFGISKVNVTVINQKHPVVIPTIQAVELLQCSREAYFVLNHRHYSGSAKNVEGYLKVKADDVML